MATRRTESHPYDVSTLRACALIVLGVTACDRVAGEPDGADAAVDARAPDASAVDAGPTSRDASNDVAASDGADAIDVDAGATTSLANLWIDPNGGSCTRTATRAAYSDPAACPSLAAAWNAAQGGDLILVRGGASGAVAYYSGDNALSGAKSAPVTIASTPGENAWFTGDLSLTDVTNAVFTDERPGANARHNIAADIGQGLVVGSSMFTSGGTSNVVFRDVDLWCQDNAHWPLHNVLAGDGPNIGQVIATGRCSVQQQIQGHTTNWTWTGGSIGPHVAGAQGIDDIKINCASAPDCNHLTWDGTWIHDWLIVSGDTSAHHDEWMKLDAGTFVSIVNNRFETCAGCGSAGIFVDNYNAAGTPPTDWLIQNNMIGATQNGIAISIGYMTTLTNFRVLYNSIDGDWYVSPSVTSGSGNQVIGNVAQWYAWGTCHPFVDYRYNVWFVSWNGSPSTCGVGATSLGPNYNLANLWVDAAHVDLHLATGSPARGRGDAANCVAVDFDGQPRPQGPCDTGADEVP